MWVYLEIGSLRRLLRLHGVIRVGPWSDRICVLTGRGRDTKDFSLCVCTQRRVCVKTLEEGSYLSKEESSYQKLTLLAPWFWISSLQKYKKINVCCLSHPVCGISLWQPELTNTEDFLLQRKLGSRQLWIVCHIPAFCSRLVKFMNIPSHHFKDKYVFIVQFLNVAKDYVYLQIYIFNLFIPCKNKKAKVYTI